MERLLPSKPETYQQIMQRSFRLYRASINNVFLLSLLLSLFLFLPRFLQLFTPQEYLYRDSILNFYRLLQVIISFTSIIIFIALLWRVFNVTKGNHETVEDDLRLGLKKFILVFFASFIQGLILVAIIFTLLTLTIAITRHQELFLTNIFGMALMLAAYAGQLIIILYVSMLFIFLLPLITIENRSIFSALETSVSLVWNHWWKVSSVQLTPWVVYLIFLVVLQIVLSLQMHYFFLALATTAYWPMFIQLLAFTFLMPWVASLLIIQLKDLELRKALAHKHGK